MTEIKMKPSRPYLLNAMLEWIVDSDCTPHVLVDALIAGVEVPQAYVNDGQIVLNISPSAVKDFYIDSAGMGFSARFGGKAQLIYAPMSAILGIYARENGQGMVFEPEDFSDTPSTPEETPPDDTPPAGGNKPALRVVK